MDWWNPYWLWSRTRRRSVSNRLEWSHSIIFKCGHQLNVSLNLSRIFISDGVREEFKLCTTHVAESRGSGGNKSKLKFLPLAFAMVQYLVGQRDGE